MPPRVPATAKGLIVGAGLIGMPDQAATLSGERMFRRSFLFGSTLAAVGRRRRRKPAQAQPASQPLNEIERAQLLAAIPDDRIRLALDIRFLELWPEIELEAELARRTVMRKAQNLQK